MLEKAYRIRLLIRKYLSGDLSGAEQKEFDAWLSASGENKRLLESFTDDTLFDNMLKEYFQSARLAEAISLNRDDENRPV